MNKPSKKEKGQARPTRKKLDSHYDLSNLSIKCISGLVSAEDTAYSILLVHLELGNTLLDVANNLVGSCKTCVGVSLGGLSTHLLGS